MDPVTAYECRHKIKKGDACHAGVSYMEWLAMSQPRDHDLIVRLLAQHHENTRMQDLVHEMARNWARGDGWHEGARPPAATPRRRMNNPIPAQRNRPEWPDWLIVIGVVTVAMFVIYLVVFGIFRMFGW